MKAEIFDINNKKAGQREIEMAMSPEERVILCLDLMDLNRELSREKFLHPRPDNIQWIELKMKNDQSNP